MLTQLGAAVNVPMLCTYQARGMVADSADWCAGVATGATIEQPLLDEADLVIGIGLDPVEFIPAPWPTEARVVLLGTWAITDSTFFGAALHAEVVVDPAALAAEVAVLGDVLSTQWAPGHGRTHRLRANAELRAVVPEHPAALVPQEVVDLAAAAAPKGSLATVDVTTLSGAALDAYRQEETRVVVNTYIGLAIALALLGGAVWMNRHKLVETAAPSENILHAFDLLKQPRFALGALCIFLYVGAEVAIGSIIVNYLMESHVLGLSAEAAGKHVPLYWGGAMVGRFIGAALLRMFSPGKVLAFAATVTIGLLLVSANTTGAVSGWSLLAIGLFNSIMFPTIFTLACEGLGKRTAEGSGVICVAIVGGAVVPLLMGHTADVAGLKMSLIVPAVCYAVIVYFGLYARRSHTT